MIRGIYCSNTGLNAIQQKMDVVANNLANVNTEGFKQGKLSIKTFQEEMNGVMADKLKNDFSDGVFRETGFSYDYAINGDAFFKINTDQGFIYTKKGTFSINEEGYLIDNYGHTVAGVNSDVKMIDGIPDQDFYLASFQNNADLTPTEGGFLATGDNFEVQAENIKVMQGFVENSNVDLIQNMADMLSVAKSFSLNSRMITAQDEMLKKAVEEVGSLK